MRPIRSAMEYLHRCVICDWERTAASPTVTSPHCENCGCALAATRAPEAAAVAERLDVLQVPPAIRVAMVRLAAVAGTAILMLAAVLTGYAEGGATIAVAAFGVAGLAVSMTLPAGSR